MNKPRPLNIPARSAAGGGESCSGCAAHPMALCACCGRPRVVVLPADGHSLSLCAACFQVLIEVAAPERADELKREQQQRQLRRRRRSVACQQVEGGAA